MSFRSFVTRLALSSAVVLVAGCGSSGSVTAPNSVLDSTPPPAPDGLAATFTPQSGTAALSWNPSAAADVAHYDIYMATGDPGLDASYVKVGQVAADVNSWEMPKNSSGMVYDCRVKAVDASSNASAYSTTLHADVPAWETSVIGGGSPSNLSRRLPE